MLESIERQKEKFDNTYSDHVNQDVKELKQMGELEYNFDNMISDVKESRGEDMEWLNYLIQDTIKDEKVVHQREEATRKILKNQVNFMKQRIKIEIDSRKTADNDIQLALDKDKELIQQKIDQKRNDIKKRD